MALFQLPAAIANNLPQATCSCSLLPLRTGILIHGFPRQSKDGAATPAADLLAVRPCPLSGRSCSCIALHDCRRTPCPSHVGVSPGPAGRHGPDHDADTRHIQASRAPVVDPANDSMLFPGHACCSPAPIHCSPARLVGNANAGTVVGGPWPPPPAAT